MHDLGHAELGNLQKSSHRPAHRAGHSPPGHAGRGAGKTHPAGRSVRAGV